MAIPSNAFSTYSVGWPYSASGASASVIGTREDAMNTLTMIDPDEAMTLAVLGRTTTNGLRHEWFTDTLQATAQASVLMGEDWGASHGNGRDNKTLKQRIRLWNHVQWFRQDWSIVMDELLLSRRGQTFGVDDELNYQIGKSGQELNRNIDAQLWQIWTTAMSYGSANPVSQGNDTTATIMGNFRAWASASGIATNAGNAQFSTAQFYGLQEAMWVTGAKPDTLFVSPGVKSDISRTLLGDVAYATAVPTGGNGIPAVAGAGVVINGEYGPVIDFIRTDFGRVATVVDRWIPQQTVTAHATDQHKNAAYFLVERSKLRVAWWRPIQPYQIASTGDNIKLYMLGACTCEVLHPSAIGHAYGVIT